MLKGVLDMPSYRILCGHSKTAIEKAGFNFFNQILGEKDLNWLKRLWQQYETFLLEFDENKRKDFILLYDLNVKIQIDKQLFIERVFHYKAIPFQLCNNGNLWLTLGYVSPSLAKKGEYNGCILNTETKKRYDYDFSDGTLTESDIAMISSVEQDMLGKFVQGISDDEISDWLGVGHTKYYDLKKILFKKLEVNSPAAAIMRAYQLGLI